VKFRVNQKVMVKLEDGRWYQGKAIGGNPRGTHLETLPGQMVQLRRPWLTVWLKGFSAPHDVDPRRVKPCTMR
jgi:hypothetical protein